MSFFLMNKTYKVLFNFEHFPMHVLVCLRSNINFFLDLKQPPYRISTTIHQKNFEKTNLLQQKICQKIFERNVSDVMSRRKADSKKMTLELTLHELDSCFENETTKGPRKRL